MVVTRSIDTVNDKLRYVSSRWSTDKDVEHSMNRYSSISKRRGQNVGDRFVVERSETPQSCLNMR